MAIYRKINTTFWSDPFICDLDPDKKLFYLYLLTNERTKQCGIYDISKRQISFDLSIDLKIVTENINFFTKNNKIMFSENTNEIAIRNWNRFNGSTSPKVITCVESELKLVKNRVLIEYIYGNYTLSQETQTKEETPTPTPTKSEAKNKGNNDSLSEELKIPPNQEKINFDKFIKFFNDNRGNLSEVKKLTDSRKKRLLILEKQYGKECLIIAIEKTRDSKFLQGINTKNWTASFDWIFKPENFIKILEDNYGNKQQQSTKTNAEIYNDAVNSEIGKSFRWGKP